MGLAFDAPGQDAAQPSAPAPLDYDEEEEAMVAERLRALGYLE